VLGCKHKAKARTIKTSAKTSVYSSGSRCMRLIASTFENKREQCLLCTHDFANRDRGLDRGHDR
jgi:hypothetical protein